MEFLSAQANYVLQFINQTHRSVFLTGKAGTGKTTLLKEIIQSTHKNCIVVAPTGIAALNAGGVTIHSMFQLPFSSFIPNNSAPQISEFSKFETRSTLRRHFKMRGNKKAVIRNLELLIIDEVSMLRADLLDAIDFVLQSVRKINAPFGGVQVLFIGDLLQLPPVVKDDEWRVLKNFYKGKYFFNAHVLEQNPILYIELSKIFRQTDEQFISVLNNLRNNKISVSDMNILNEFVQPNFDLKANKGYITLTTHNAKADQINTDSLFELEGVQKSFYAEIEGDFPEKIFPIEEKLELKVGAQIMFIKNDLSFEKNYFNGKMGIIKSLSDREILVHFPDENKTIEVEKYEWQNIKYTVNQNTKEIEEEVIGTFVHYPIKLAWAITVHKSQGLTFDKAALDVSRVFLPGQAYVALSRLRSLSGLVLLAPIQMNGITNDEEVMYYAQNKASEEQLEQTLQKDTHEYAINYLTNCFNFSALAQEWRNHLFSYPNDDEFDKKSKATKSNHTIWAKKQHEIIDNLVDPSRKFMQQLQKLMAQNPDYNFILERIHAAFNYFFTPLDQVVEAILWKLEEVKRLKKVQTFYEDLLVLEEAQIKAIVKLYRAKLFIELLQKGETLSKEKLTSEEIQRYRIHKLEKIREEFKKANLHLIEDEEDIDRYAKKLKKKSTSKETKKSTVQETFELWKQQLSVEDIAVQRKLTTNTIYSHLAKLIEAKSITLDQVLPQDKIDQLEQAFLDYNEQSLSELKEQLGDQFSWDELKLYRASL